MSSANTTLTSLWVDDGSPTTLRTSCSDSVNTSAHKQTDLMASTHGEVVFPNQLETKPQIQIVNSQPRSGKGVQYVYISSPTKQILPKTEPMVVSNLSPHRSVAGGVQRLTTYSIHGAAKRPASIDTITVDALDSKRPRKAEKGGKGLRHFSMKVCEKVEAKGITTYNEVAEELVEEFTDPRFSQSEQAQYDQKNIRRRVYDALNVLMAMNIISKEKKEIRWIGLPTNSAQEYQNLELEKCNRQARIEQKKQKLQELIVQQIAYKNLVNRNAQTERSNGPPAENSKIQLPFVIVNTNKKTVIDCSISHDKYEYLFNFDNTFEIHDDIEILKRMGLTYGLEKGQCSSSDLEKAVEMLPKSLEPYIRGFGAPTKSGGDALLASTSEADIATNILSLTNNL